MRIEKLRLPAYGPFTATEFDLAEGRGRLELVYGSNEAGKTSLLRGISALLFGIPAQTKDAFLHPYGDLRIGATLEHEGQRLQFIRRKGNKNTLRHADDQVLLSDSELSAFVPIASEQIFRLMFGLDGQRLAEGGEELLSGQGEFGSLLFGAATGIVGLRKIQEGITARAEKLFRPKAHSSSIQQVLSRRDANRKVLREASVAAPELEELFARQAQAATDQERLRRLTEDHSAEIARLQRLRMAMGLLNRRRLCLEELEALGPVALLREAMAVELDELNRRAQALGAERTQTETTIQLLTDALVRLQFSSPLLAAQRRIEALYKRLGAEVKAQADRPKLNTEMSGAEYHMRDLLASLGGGLELAAVPGLRVPVADGELAGNLIEHFPVLKSSIRQAEADEAGYAQEIGKLQARRDELPQDVPDEILRQAYDSLLTVADLDTQQPLRRQKLASNEAKLAQKVQALPWQSGLTQLALGPFPAEAIVHEWKSRLSKAAQTIEKARESSQTAKRDLEQCQAAMQRQQAARRLSSLTDLRTGRGRRDLGWQAIRHAWLNSNLDTVEAKEFLGGDAEPARLADTYAGSVAETDRLADDLREHASEIAQLAQLQAEVEAADARLVARSKELKEAQERQRQLEEEWSSLWAPTGITASGPEQMLVWLGNRQKLVEQGESLSEERGSIDADSARLLTAREEVRRALGTVAGQVVSPEIAFAELKASAGTCLKRREKEAHDRQALLTQHQSAEAKLAQTRLKLEIARRDMDGWKDQWCSLLARLQMSIDTEPRVAKKILTLRGELAKKHDEAARLNGRIASMDRDKKEFESLVRALAEEVAPDLEYRAASDVVEELHGRLLQGLNTQKLRQEKEKEEAEARGRLQFLTGSEAAIVAGIAALVLEAGCESAAQLPERTAQSGQRRKLERERRQIEDDISNIAGTSSLVELEEQAAALSPDLIPGRIEELQREIAETNGRRDQALTDKDAATNKIASLSSRLDAAAAAADLEAANAELLELSEEYVRLTMAGQILRQAVEEFGSRASGPMMDRSKAIFAQLTRGSFSGLQVDVESDRTILVGVRPSGKLVQMDGMSEGTRDQLYLALRVASLELYFEQHPPVPLIMDDLLVHFDNERAINALEVLAGLASKTQVLLFTHHHHLVELARGCLPADSMAVYRFGTTSAAG